MIATSPHPARAPGLFAQTAVDGYDDTAMFIWFAQKLKQLSPAGGTERQKSQLVQK